MVKYAKLLRVKHYIKNMLVFFPLVFSGQFFVGEAFLKTVIGFLAFSASASLIYIINDIKDLENDRRHPIKCGRPLACGEITLVTAKIAISLLCILTLVLNWLVARGNWMVWAIIVAYVGCNTAYSFGVKNIALVDVFILVIGYVLRIYYGALLINTSISSWLYLTVLSMAFFLGFGKRRNELRNQGESSRRALLQYSPEFLDKSMYLCLGLTIVFYSLWCEAMAQLTKQQFFLFSIPIALLICMRYSMDIEGESEGDPVEVVFADKLLLLLISFYAVVMLCILYGGKLLNIL